MRRFKSIAQTQRFLGSRFNPEPGSRRSSPSQSSSPSTPPGPDF
jgi:hypothetical protein